MTTFYYSLLEQYHTKLSDLHWPRRSSCKTSSWDTYQYRMLSNGYAFCTGRKAQESTFNCQLPLSRNV